MLGKVTGEMSGEDVYELSYRAARGVATRGEGWAWSGLSLDSFCSWEILPLRLKNGSGQDDALDQIGRLKPHDYRLQRALKRSREPGIRR